MKKLVFCLIGMVGYLIAAVTSAHSQEPHEPQQHHHQDYADQKNPVPLTGQSVAKGRKAYSKNCSSCHGDSGKGGIGPDLTDKVSTVINVINHRDWNANSISNASPPPNTPAQPPVPSQSTRA